MTAKRLLVVLCLLGVASVIAAADEAEQEPARIPGVTAESSDHQRGIEAQMVDLLDPASTARHFRILTEEPHPAGSKENLELAHYVRDQFVAAGLPATIEALHVVIANKAIGK